MTYTICSRPNSIREMIKYSERIIYNDTRNDDNINSVQYVEDYIFKQNNNKSNSNQEDYNFLHSSIKNSNYNNYEDNILITKFRKEEEPKNMTSLAKFLHYILISWIIILQIFSTGYNFTQLFINKPTSLFSLLKLATTIIDIAFYSFLFVISLNIDYFSLTSFQRIISFNLFSQNNLKKLNFKVLLYLFSLTRILYIYIRVLILSCQFYSINNPISTGKVIQRLFIGVSILVFIFISFFSILHSDFSYINKEYINSISNSNKAYYLRNIRIFTSSNFPETVLIISLYSLYVLLLILIYSKLIYYYINNKFDLKNSFKLRSYLFTFTSDNALFLITSLPFNIVVCLKSIFEFIEDSKLIDSDDYYYKYFTIDSIINFLIIWCLSFSAVKFATDYIIIRNNDRGLKAINKIGKIAKIEKLEIVNSSINNNMLNSYSTSNKLKNKPNFIENKSLIDDNKIDSDHKKGNKVDLYNDAKKKDNDDGKQKKSIYESNSINLDKGFMERLKKQLSTESKSFIKNRELLKDSETKSLPCSSNIEEHNVDKNIKNYRKKQDAISELPDEENKVNTTILESTISKNFSNDDCLIKYEENLSESSVETSQLSSNSTTNNIINEDIESNLKPSTQIFVESCSYYESYANEFSNLINFEFLCCIVFGFNNMFNQSRPLNIEYIEDSDKMREIIQVSNYTHCVMYSVKEVNEYIDDSETIDKFNNNSSALEEIGGMNKPLLDNIYSNSSNNEFTDNILKSIKNNNTSNNTQMSRNSNNENLHLFIKQNNPTKSKHIYQANIIEHFPKSFSLIRKIDNILNEEITEAFNPILNKDSLRTIKESEGKSGSFFFNTHDKKFILKTISNTEKNTINENFIEQYTSFMQQNGETSFITKIYGVFTIILTESSSINVILMPNIIQFPYSLISKVFDLKGSRIDRLTLDFNSTVKNKLRALKDLDFIWINDTQGIADFNNDAINEITLTLDSDLAFLRSLNLMDYSLLVVIINFPKKKNPHFQEIINMFGNTRFYRKMFKSRTSKYIYCLGLIDYLQVFNLTKFLENKYKKLFYWSDVKYISAVDPTNYAQRMKDFLKENLFVINKFKND